MTPHLDEAVAVDAAIERRRGLQGALLPILHDVQDALGFVPPAALPRIAEALNLSRAEVHGVVTYYHHFRHEEPPRHIVQVCRAEACRAMGAEALWAHARRHLGCDDAGRSRDGAVLVEAAYCLGLCASSPALFIDEEPHARVTPARFDVLIDDARSAA